MHVKTADPPDPTLEFLKILRTDPDLAVRRWAGKLIRGDRPDRKPTRARKAKAKK
jgi:hypothetical protein